MIYSHVGVRLKPYSIQVQDDVISQSSYMSNMTYATTISEHSVNYGPAWEKVRHFNSQKWEAYGLFVGDNRTNFGEIW
jgi:hypothetical protein